MGSAVQKPAALFLKGWPSTQLNMFSIDAEIETEPESMWPRLAVTDNKEA